MAPPRSMLDRTAQFQKQIISVRSKGSLSLSLSMLSLHNLTKKKVLHIGGFSLHSKNVCPKTAGSLEYGLLTSLNICRALKSHSMPSVLMKLSDAEIGLISCKLHGCPIKTNKHLRGTVRLEIDYVHVDDNRGNVAITPCSTRGISAQHSSTATQTGR